MEHSEERLNRERADRLKEAVRLAGTAAAVAKRIGMPPPTLNNYLGGRDMKASALVALAEACSVSIEWLATGQGDMNSTASVASSRWEAEFRESLHKPASFFVFCLLMANCQEYFHKVKRRPSLGDALAWIGGPYRASIAAGGGGDSLVAETFKDPRKTRNDPWIDIDAAV